MLPHDLTIAVIGGLILWFGWYGFNPCSTLSIMDNAGVGRVAMNTTLAACTGGLAAVFVMYFHDQEVGHRAPSSTASSPAWWRSPAPATGSATSARASSARSPVCSSSSAMELLEYLRIDDPVGAWPVHGVCGIWGTLSLGLFACGQYSAAGSSPTGVPDDRRQVAPTRSPACSTAAA